MSEEEGIDLELQVLGLAFRKDGAVEYFAKNLPAEDVGLPRDLKGVYEVYRQLINYWKETKEASVDPTAFRAWLEYETDIAEAVGGSDQLDLLFRPAMSTELSTPEAVSALVKRRARESRRRQAVESLMKKVEAGAPEEEVDELLQHVRSLGPQSLESLLDAVSTGSDIADRVDGLYELPDFLPTPFPALNRALSYSEDGGLAKGSVYAVVAASGAGKSTLAKSLMNHWVGTGHEVLFVNYEESESHWERILFNQLTGWNPYTINQMSQEDRDRAGQLFRDKLGDWGDRFIVHHNPDTVFFEDIEMWLREVVRQRREKGQDIDAVIIDTIQSVFLKAGSSLPRWGQYEVMMVRLEALAKELDCVFMITAQENNNRVKEKREVVEQSDIGGSVTIVQKCTAVMVLMKKSAMEGDQVSGSDSFVEIQIPKNRITGETYSLEPPLLKFDDKQKSFESIDINTAAIQSSIQSIDDVAGFFEGAG